MAWLELWGRNGVVVGNPFGDLLRRLRTEAGLTQEELATAATVSPRTVSDLERGTAETPRKDTALLLAAALGLAGPVLDYFLAAARGRAPAGPFPTLGAAAPATRTLPRDIASFTGREQELAQLVGVTEGAAQSGGVVGIHVIGGMAGVGKTALAVHAAHQLAPQFPDGQVFLPLHGHSAGQQPMAPADALASLLLTIGVPAAQVPPGLEERMALWRDRLAGRRLLLLLDDAADSEQVQPLLPGSAGCLVLVTSRRHLTALDDATAISLDTLPPEQAAALLVRLAARPGLGPEDAAVGEITLLCGYLPLAVGMLARQLHHHPAWTAAELAQDLTKAHDRLELMHAENLSVVAAFDLSYRDLTPGQQQLFRRLGLHPGPDIDAYAAAAVDGTSLAEAHGHLEDLYDQYLIAEPAHGRYRFHDLIRERARALAASDQPAEGDAATGRLFDYYQYTAAVAGALLARQTRPGPPPAAPAMLTVFPGLEDYGQALAWARAERANLLACLDHATGTGQQARMIALTAGIAALLRHDGPWSDAIARHNAAAQAAQDLGDRLGEANALNDLGDAQYMTDDFPAATRALEQALGLYRHLGDRLGEANALSDLGIVRGLTDDFPGMAQVLEQALGLYRDLGNRLGQAYALRILGDVRRVTGDFPGAAEALEQALGLYRDLGNRFGQAFSLRILGDVRRETGEYPAAARALEQALGLYRDLGNRLGQASVLHILGAVRRVTGDFPGAAGALEQALGLYHDLGDRIGQANALTDLGGVRRMTGDFPAAAEALEQALATYRDLGSRLGQANALTELGAVRRETGDFPAAAEALEQALGIYRDLGDRSGEVKALNQVGALRRVSGELAQAEGCHQQALDLARDIVSPWDEAHALAGLGRCAMAADHATQARDLLRQALDIFQRIGAAEAPGVAAELDAIPG